jgi:glycosyltransferase involved in cell wall biosynthesis
MDIPQNKRFMKIAYINKTRWLSNMPSTVFSALNAYAFAENGHNSTIIFKDARNNGETTFEEFFDLPMLPNFALRTFDDRRLFAKANEFFYSNALRWILRENPSFDIVITRDPGSLPQVARLRKHGIKIFYQAHNFYLDLERNKDVKRINAEKYSRNERRFLPKFDGILALNRPQKELYEEFVNVPVMDGKPGLERIHKPIDNFDNKVVVYSGSFQLQKGVSVLMEAFALCQTPDAKFVLAGGRSEEEIAPIRNLARKLQIENRITITGWMNYAQLEQHLAKATVGIIPLVDNFYNRYLTAPTKLFDYLAFGIPVIASDLPSIRDFVSDSDALAFVPPERPEALAWEIDNILNNRKVYEELSNNSHHLARSYLWKNRANAMIEFMHNPRKYHG